MSSRYLRRWLISLLICGMIGMGLTVTGSAATTASDGITIDEVDFLVENIHPSFWAEATDPDSARLYFDFFIYVKDLKNVINQIKQVRVYDMYDSYWTLDLNDDIDLEEGDIGGYGRWNDGVMTENGSLLAVKNLRVEIITNNDELITKEFSIPEPGTIDSFGKSFVYCETYRGRITGDHTLALKLGIINSAKLSKNGFTAKFAVNDARVANGQFVFYDRNKDYVGETPFFLNKYSGEVIRSLNGGKNFNTSGSNTMQIETSQIQWDDGKGPADICYALLYLRDGRQFIGTANPTNFYFVSRSEMVEVK